MTGFREQKIQETLSTPACQVTRAYIHHYLRSELTAAKVCCSAVALQPPPRDSLLALPVTPSLIGTPISATPHQSCLRVHSGPPFPSLLPPATKPEDTLSHHPSSHLCPGAMRNSFTSPATQQNFTVNQERLTTDHPKGQHQPRGTSPTERRSGSTVTCRCLNIF